MKASVSRYALLVSALCIFSAFAASCSSNTGKKESKSADEPETPEYSYSVSPEDFSAAVFSGINRDCLYEEFDTLFAAANAEDPFASAVGYMVDDDVLNISFLGNDDPINSFNHMLSSATGNTPDYLNAFVPKPYFSRIDVTPGYNEEIIAREEYCDQIAYQCKPGSGDAYVDADLTMPEDGRLCFHIGAETYRKSNVWLSHNKDGDDFTDFESLGSYGENGKYHVLEAGTFNKGEDIRVRFSFFPDEGMNYSGNEYFAVRTTSGFNFYYADESAVNSDLEQFTAQPFILDVESSTYEELVGTVTAEEGKILMTCLPYDVKHKIKVDGKKFDSLVDKNLNNGSGDEGEVVVFGKFIGLKLPEGEHEIKISFTEDYDEEEYQAAADFAELIFEGSSSKLFELMFPEDFTGETDEEELTGFFFYASVTFEDMLPGCKLISKSIRRVGKANENELSSISGFYSGAYERFGMDSDVPEIESASIYLLIVEFENGSGETERIYQPGFSAEIDGEWCVYFL